MKKRILFRCDGGDIPEIGMGHVARAKLLAAELVKRPGTEVSFLMRNVEGGVRALREAGFEVSTFDSEAEEPEATAKRIRDWKADIVVMDRLTVPEKTLKAVKETGAVLIALDHDGPGHDLIDCSINPLKPTGQSLYEGYEYMVLPPRPVIRRESSAGRSLSVFVSFGGYDRHDITQKFLTSLNGSRTDARYDVAVDQGYKGFSDLKKRFAGPRVKLHQGPPDYFERLARADLAVTSGGTTMFQAVSCGVPCLVVSQYEHQVENARRLEAPGAVLNLGLATEIDFAEVHRKIAMVSQDEARLNRMSYACRAILDGQGTRRVAEIIGIVDELRWDSDFFGIPIAQLYPSRLRESIVKFAMEKCAEESIDCLYYLCDSNDRESVRLAEKHGFHFVDIRVTLLADVRKIRTKWDRKETPRLAVREAVPADIPALTEIAKDLYVHSRYFFDSGFPTEKCRRFYSDWIAKSVTGGFDTCVLVAETDGRIAGYCSCRRVSGNFGAIGLVGVGPKDRGKNAGGRLIEAALEWFDKNDIPHVEVVTQGRNIQAQRLYQYCGFRTSKLELWYHKWFKN